MNVVSTHQSPIITYVSKGKSQVSLSDEDDACMKACIASYEIFNKNEAFGDDRDEISEFKVILYLRQDLVTPRYVKEDGSEVDYKGDKEADMVALAVESVLKHLHKAGCVGKDMVPFQSKRDLKVNPLSFIMLTPKVPSFFCLDYNNGSVSNAYAYLTEGKACLFLNKVQDNLLNKMGSVLDKHIPRKI